MADDRKGDDLFEDLDKFFAPIKDVDWDEPEEQAPVSPQEEHVAVRSGEPSEPSVAHDAPETSEAQIDEVTIVEDEPESPRAEVGDEVDDGVGGGFWDTPDEPAPTADQPVAEVESEEPPLVGVGSDEEPTAAELEAAAEHFADAVRQERYDTEPVAIADQEPRDDPSTEGFGDDAAAVEESLLADIADDQPEVATVIVGSEGMSGPSWQEPAAVEVGADLDRDVGERDVPAAFLTGTILAGVAVVSLLIGPAAFAVVAGAIVLVAQGELFGVMVRRRQQPATAVGLIAGALMAIGAYQRGVEAIPAMLSLGVIATFLWYLTVPAMQRKDILVNAGLTILNMAWIPLLAAYLIALAAEPDGVQLVIAVVGLTYLYDTAAFMSGTVLGGAWFRRGMAPATSPKKSWEGLLIATVVTVFFAAALVASFVAPFNDRQFDAVLLGLVVAAAATLGDLAESLVKRDLDVKDMSTVLPGHGGVLDRIDSLLFVAPAAYLLLGVVDIV